jgi:hypothetical protein
MYLVGFVLFVVLGKYRARQNLLTGWHPRDVDDMLFYGVFGVILGGRLGYVLFYKPLYYLAHPLEVGALWQGGMSFHGGFLGVLIALVLFAHRRHKRWLEVTDFVAPLCPWALPPGGLATSSTESSGVAPRICRGGWCFRRSISFRAIHRSYTNWASKVFCCSSCFGFMPGAGDRSGPCPAFS